MVYSLHPYTGVGLFASAFGCRTEFPAIGDPVTHPVLHSIDEVDRLTVDLAKADLVNLTIDKIKYFLDRTHGQVPVSFPDLQSPMNVASLVLDYTELLCALATDPEKVHTLLRMITDVMEEVLARIAVLLPEWSPNRILLAAAGNLAQRRPDGGAVARPVRRVCPAVCRPARPDLRRDLRAQLRQPARRRRDGPQVPPADAAGLLGSHRCRLRKRGRRFSVQLPGGGRPLAQP